MKQASIDDMKMALSQHQVQQSDSIETMYLTFPVESELYGVSIAKVTEIVGLQKIMSVPDVPAYIKGVINLRGKVIPLMDIRLRFGLAEKSYDDRTVVIVLQISDAPVGLIVDGVNEVLDIPDDQIDRPRTYANSDSASLVKGLARLEDRVAILLEADLLIDAQDVALPVPEQA